jgi:hypothetical protein
MHMSGRDYKHTLGLGREIRMEMVEIFIYSSNRLISKANRNWLDSKGIRMFISIIMYGMGFKKSRC